MSQNKLATQIEINKVHNVAWAIVKHIVCSLEEDDDFNNNFFYTFVISSSKPISVETLKCMQIDIGIKGSSILLTYDEGIVHQVLKCRKN